MSYHTAELEGTWACRDSLFPQGDELFILDEFFFALSKPKSLTKL